MSRTLVIGLGGYGCRMANALLSRVGGGEGQVIFQGIDTDRMNYGASFPMTYLLPFSPRSPGDMLKENPSAQEWLDDSSDDRSEGGLFCL